MKRCYWQTLLISLLILILSTMSAQATLLEYEDRGPEVKKVQQLLSKIGYDLTVDGIYGNRTRNIVQDFQANNGITVDGIVGEKTYNLLQERSNDIIYEVKPGDTLSEIALKFDVKISDIRANNQITSSKIIAGDELRIPKTGVGGGQKQRISSNVIHTVKRGEALLTLARRYGTSVNTIKAANNLKSNRIYVGQELVIPHNPDSNQGQFQLGKNSFIWPVMGRISSNYGWRQHPVRGTREFHDGIDIAVPVGTEIRAAAPGKVVRAGWLSGFGKTVTIDHGDNIKTIYAHNSRLLVATGQRVHTGKVIARAGSTGLSTGSHLHFGVMVNDESINPRSYLP